MVDQSELPFRMLCRRHGATCAYTPMFHARLFSEDPKYRAEMFSTCQMDRPLFVQFCAHDPEHLVKAAQKVAPHVDAIDINFGCPQRIAKRGFYGAFLMDDLSLVQRLVSSLAQGVYPTPVACKIRIFPQLEDTLAYARMIEQAGCSVLAVHGRCRDQKDASASRADWDAIKAVKQALSIPVLANGNIRHVQDAEDCLAYTGCDGVLSAESLLEDPALYDPMRRTAEGAHTAAQGIALSQEYLALCLEHPVPLRMVKGHLHKMLGGWLAEYTDLRDAINTGYLDVAGFQSLVAELAQRVEKSGRSEPVPVIPARALARMEKEAAEQAAINEQEREASALWALGALEDMFAQQ